MRPKDNIRKLTRIGRNSLGVLLPAALLRVLGWRERQRLIVKRMPRGILIRDAMTKKKKN
jgi:bifunctional DNA-binding transcriptional regulator/antitoxin component of YhaV-PrlF toxin-antitoxin module